MSGPSSAPPGSGARRVPAPAWWAVLAVALAARLAFVAVTPPRILWRDGQQYEAVALSLVETGSYGPQTLRPPGYPTLIAAVYRVTGRNLVALRTVEAALGTLSVGLVGAVGVSLFGPLAGWIAALLAALDPVLAFMPSTQYAENTLVLVLVLAFAAAFAAWRRGGLGRWALAGVLFGAALLVRPNTLVMLPGIGLGFAAALHRRRRAWLAPALVCTLAAAVTVTPWIVRNHRVHHHWYFIATGGGRQFWFGNNEHTRAATDEASVPDSAMFASAVRLPDDIARERYFYDLGMAFVREHPERAARLYLTKLGNLFALYPKPYSHQVRLGPWSRLAQGLASAVVFAGALLMLRRFRRDPALWPMVAGIVTFALVNAVFFTVMRYRLAFEPCLLWMAGAGWAGLFGARGVSR